MEKNYGLRSLGRQMKEPWFLTDAPDEFKAQLEKNPNFKLISMEAVTPEMFLAHEASKQESLGLPEAQSSEPYLQQQLALATAGNYWAKYNLWDSYVRGKNGVAKNPEQAGRWLPELVQGVYVAKFEAASGLNPRTPKEMLNLFNEYCHLRSGKETIGGASFFRTTKQSDQLIGSFLTDAPEEFKAELEKSPNCKLISIEKLTTGKFLEYEASRQESL